MFQNRKWKIVKYPEKCGMLKYWIFGLQKPENIIYKNQILSQVTRNRVGMALELVYSVVHPFH